MTARWDETWHRLLNWRGTDDQAHALARQMLPHCGYQVPESSAILPTAQVLYKQEQPFRLLTWFVTGAQRFAALKKPLRDALAALSAHTTPEPIGITLLLNQELTLSERTQLATICTALGFAQLELFHLERLCAILDQPHLANLRQEFLHFGDEEAVGHAPGLLLRQDWLALQTGYVKGEQLIIQHDERYALSLACPEFETPEPSIGALLTWRARIPAKLYGRAQEMFALQAWADEGTDGRNLRVRVLHGAAGSGKTRLAFEFAEQLQKQGWQVGQLFDPASEIAFSLAAAGTLLIIDYPEQYLRALENLLKAMLNLPCPSRLRILLLCRDAKTVSDLIAAHAAELQSPPLALPALAHSEVAWKLFVDGWHRMRHLLQLPLLPPPLDENGLQVWMARDAQHETPLMVLAFALNLIYQPQAHSLRKVEILKSLVQRERLRMADEIACFPALHIEGVELLKALAALPGRLGMLELRDLKTYLDGDSLCLPSAMQLQDTSLWQTGAVGAAGGVLEWQPDLLAAYLFSMVLHEHLATSAQLAQWIWHGLMVCEPEWQVLRSRFTRLARLCMDSVAAMDGAIPFPLLAALQDHLDPNQAQVITVALHLHDEALESPLQSLAVAAAECTIAELEERATQDFAAHAPDLANNLANLSTRLAANGAFAAGLARCQQAVAILEELARRDFARYAPSLALVLNNLSIRLAENGDPAAGLAPILRALNIREELAKQDFAKYGQLLATSLNNLSNRFDEAGNAQDGLAAALRAVQIMEQLIASAAPQDVAAYTPDLARSLTNASIRFAACGHSSEGLQAIERAVALYQELAQQNYAAYAPELAASLNSLAHRLDENGDHVAGLASIAHSVTINEELARQNLPAYAADLARSLHNWSNSLDVNGDRAAAMAANQRALALYEDLALQNMTVHGAHLVTCLDARAQFLLDQADASGALQVAQHAARILEALAAHNFAAYAPDWAVSLNNLALDLAQAGDDSAALATLQRALAIYDNLAQQDFAGYAANLATGLNNLSYQLAKSGDVIGGLAASQRAVAMLENLAAQDFAEHARDWAASLNNLSLRLAENAQANAGLAAIKQAVAIGESLAQQNSEEYGSDLACSLNNLAARLLDCDELEAAINALQRAITIIEPFALKNEEDQDQQQRMQTSLKNLIAYKADQAG